VFVFCVGFIIGHCANALAR